MLSPNQTEFVQVDTLANREMNPMAHACDNESLENPLATQGNENGENSSKNCKSFKYGINEHQESSKKDHNDAAYSKYNVDLKCVKKQKLLAKQTGGDENDSDSEDSIFEVPVPPKPKPLLIDLQDSDEESNTNSRIDDLILKKWNNTASIKTYSKIIQSRNHELKIMETSSNHQNISSKNKNIDRVCNHNTISPDKSMQTSTSIQKITEDIVLNCTSIQRGAKSITEIKQLSKSIKVNQGNKSTEDVSQNCKKKSLQNKSKGNNENNANLQQEISVTSGRKSQVRTQQNVDQSNVYNVSHLDQVKMSEIELCNSVMNRKRCNNEVDNHPKQKRQCTIQQSNQGVRQGNNEEEKRNTSNKYFEPMSEEMRNYYNSTHGQENFDIGELQQSMSKDPRMWAILDEDIMPCPSSRQRTRFWNVKCTNRHQDDHQLYDSSPRKMSCCFMCGVKGHTESRCPQKMCLTCGKQQNTFRNTCEYCRVLYCTMCNSVGHELEQCPDLWRRYHQTTDMSSAPQDPGNVMKPSRLLYCCNCAKRGHESSTCKEYRWSEHFPTPAVVTNYTDGPTYAPYTPSSSRSNPETSFLSEMTRNETSIPQNITDTQYATEDVESSANIDTLISNLNFCVPSTSQETVSISQMEGNLKSPITNKIWSTVKTNFRQTKVNHVTFNSITYSCGNFHDKNHKDARMILKNLTAFFINRKSMLKSLINREVTPVFLEILLEKPMKFEVKIGFTQHQTLSLQLLAMKEYIEYLYDLLEYWLNLPDDEKDYGIDVTLPINPIKMFNVLNSRMPQLEKMHFTYYVEQKLTKGTNDPRWIYNFINNEKAKLKQFKGNKKRYNCLRKKLWQLQIKLLIIVNFEPVPNVFVCTFREVMKKFESERHQMGERLDITTYLRLILLYNQLFVPHTPESIYNTLHRIQIKENNSLQMQQEPETTMCEQENLTYNVSSLPMSSCIPQNSNHENSFAINNQNNEMLIEEQIVNNMLETNKIIDHNEIITTKSSPTQDSQIMPLNIELVSAESEDSKRNEDQLRKSTTKITVKSANKQNINVNNSINVLPLYLTKNQRRKRLQKLKKTELNTNIDRALDLIRKARAFELPHMMNAADEMQRRINNRTIKPNHIRTLSKLILLEERYRKNIDTYCKNLKVVYKD